jgi:hypothetical protein
MKPTIYLSVILAVLCIASAHARQQAPPFNESLAYARLIAAHTLPTVTQAQCFNAATDWLERDKADKKEPWWFQRLSTEELTRMASLSNACATEAIGHARPNATSVGAFIGRTSQFQNILLHRAETVLHDHSLIQEYLLQP